MTSLVQVMTALVSPYTSATHQLSHCQWEQAVSDPKFPQHLSLLLGKWSPNLSRLHATVTGGVETLIIQIHQFIWCQFLTLQTDVQPLPFNNGSMKACLCIKDKKETSDPVALTCWHFNEWDGPLSPFHIQSLLLTLPPSFVIFFLASLNPSSHFLQRDVTGDEEEEKGGGRGAFKQKFNGRKERRKRWNDISNNVCHGCDGWIGEMSGQLLVCQK